MEGRLLADGAPVTKPGDMLPKESNIRIRPGRRYVSRGGFKIEGAFNDLGITAKEKNAVDIGSSTGGFTDYLIKNGAKSVTAIDVGYGLLAWELRNCEKVRLLEKTNIRNLNPSVLGFRADLVVTDVSFISIKKIFKKIMDISSEDAEAPLREPSRHSSRTQNPYEEEHESADQHNGQCTTGKPDDRSHGTLSPDSIQHKSVGRNNDDPDKEPDPVVYDLVDQGLSQSHYSPQS